LKAKVSFDEPTTITIPAWIYAIGAGLLVIILLLIFLVIRTRRKQYEDEIELDEMVQDFGPSIEVPDVNETQETEDTLRRKQLEKMAKENPEEFAKLLRTWIAEE
jgi:flagellar M-ring protein FliF